MSPPLEFPATFQALTGNPPFPWQQALYDRFMAGSIPASCNLPTGLGKTSVIAVWLIALANGATVPRRLVYVVNRRTVVDQTTDEVEKYKTNAVPGVPEFALSTLRGQFADNREWSADPSKPAVICGTVDMIGSRLLFSGYGIGFKQKPLHAGFLGQDALLVHDEAHLEPAFQKLILAIEREQARCQEFRPFRVMELTATSRGDGEAFGLTDADHQNDTVRQRITAHKAIQLHDLKDEKKLADQLAELALRFKASGLAVLVFVRTVDDVLKVRDRLAKEKLPAETLTGTMRGKERDELATANKTFGRFLPKPPDDATPGTVYLLCTSAGEVGVNISADHLVCDLSTFESMAQRLGRVNRFGARPDTEVHVVHPTKFADEDYDQRRAQTLELLRRLNGNGSPTALGNLPADDRQAAFAPTPVILPVTDVLFDAWALTTIRDRLPGRPKVEPYLHGVADWQPPETQVAWREEVEKLQPESDGDDARKAFAKLAGELLEDFPLKPHELLQDKMTRVRGTLATLAERHPDKSAWVVDEDGEVTVTTLADLAKTGKTKTDYAIDSRSCTILLPPSAGGLTAGMLDPKADTAADVSCLWFADKERLKPRRARQEETDKPPAGMRPVRRVELPGPVEDDAPPRYWYWFELANEGGNTSKKPVEWHVHVGDVERAAERIVANLTLDESLKVAVRLAAKFHDHGKVRKLFQTVLGNAQYSGLVLAKSGKKGGKVAETYRHEFGSLMDVQQQAEWTALGTDQQELALHLIAAHHGRARPHFPADEAFDPNHPPIEAEKMAAGVPRRFARLQRQYGRWGLAYLESLLRAADWAASAAPSKYLEGEQ